MDYSTSFSFRKSLFEFLQKKPTNHENQTFLHLACSIGHARTVQLYPAIDEFDIISLLVDCGIDVNAVSKSGTNPYYEHLINTIWQRIAFRKSCRKKRRRIAGSISMKYKARKETKHSHKLRGRASSSTKSARMSVVRGRKRT